MKDSFIKMQNKYQSKINKLIADTFTVLRASIRLNKSIILFLCHNYLASHCDIFLKIPSEIEILIFQNINYL